MGKTTKIEWTDHTFNPWTGCTKVSPGCKHCYAEAMMDKRFGRVQWGPAGHRVKTSAANWRKPPAWYKAAVGAGERRRVFCASLADVFEHKLDQAAEMDAWRNELWELIEATAGDAAGGLDWLLLTKRPHNVLSMVPAGWVRDGFPANVWIGTSVENQATADERIPYLSEIPAAVRFLSVEPLLERVDLGDTLSNDFGINWIIVGGESGPDARPMHPEWVRAIRDEAEENGVPFFFKQWGEYWPEDQWEYDPELVLPDTPDILLPEFGGLFLAAVHRIGKTKAGRRLDGCEWNQIPQVKDYA